MRLLPHIICDLVVAYEQLLEVRDRSIYSKESIRVDDILEELRTDYSIQPTVPYRE